jgi:hypothetical protein
MRRYINPARIFSALVLAMLSVLFMRMIFVRWWIVLPVGLVILVCYWLKIRDLFSILVVIAVLLVGMGAMLN